METPPSAKSFSTRFPVWMALNHLVTPCWIPEPQLTWLAAADAEQPPCSPRPRPKTTRDVFGQARTGLLAVEGSFVPSLSSSPFLWQFRSMPASSPEGYDSGVIDTDFRSAESFALGSRGGQPGTQARTDELSLKLRDRGKDAEHQPTLGCRSVHAFVQRNKIDRKYTEFPQ